MNFNDMAIVRVGLHELYSVTGPRYKEACRVEQKANQEKRDAEASVQEKFRPQWTLITNIIRRELKKRGLTGDFGYGNHGDHVNFVPDNDPPSVSIGHIDYDTAPSIRVEVWIGHGVKLEWSGYSKTAEKFARKFDVFLATIDGYMAGVKAAGGKTCETCGMPKVTSQYKGGQCDRCKKCVGGSLWL
jgi:hypothetical protein